MAHIGKINSSSFLLLLMLIGCSHIPQSTREAARKRDAFYLSQGNLVYAYIEPITLRSVLSGIPGSIPAVATTHVEAAYLDYAPTSLQAKVFGRFPRNWINASLWERRGSFENHSSLNESRFKIKGTSLHLTLPSQSLAYLSSQDFYSPTGQNELRAQATPASSELVKHSRGFPLYLRVASIKELLSSLKIEVPSIVRLPFDQLEGTLSLIKDEAELTLNFASNSGGTPPTLAVRFALNYVFGQYPTNPLADLWKHVPIIVNPDNHTEVTAYLKMSQKDLNRSLGIIAQGYYENQAREEKRKREEARWEKLKAKEKGTQSLLLIEGMIVKDNLTPVEA